MDLSRRDAFRPCSRDSSDDKVNFVLPGPKKNFFNWTMTLVVAFLKIWIRSLF